jgi:hypothetical protein
MEEELIAGAESLFGLGGEPLVSAGNDDAHETNVTFDTNVDAGTHDSHNVSTSVDSHNTTFNYYGAAPATHDGESHGGATAHHGHAHADPQVLALQQRLLEEGFDPGALDGIMGPHTEAALLAQQAAYGHHGDHEGHHHHGDHGHHEHHEHHEHQHVEVDDYEEHHSHHQVDVEEEGGEAPSDW